ncbi:hypothetical protein PHAVU_009G035700 [Phaseolus vulgaris]|uniref:Uncharacterized protein n=1 Tax=Phaseolus vulgaris TaxID=3885 RepID=V7AVR2_PHAVU|nr:hypothetical protein PHAVU_009G035700g [Phaseolus vulgaris]ESW08316.1 hypothetical protein PHAVU_009G035700g [Phaseolus vulgaris]
MVLSRSASTEAFSIHNSEFSARNTEIPTLASSKAFFHLATLATLSLSRHFVSAALVSTISKSAFARAIFPS